MYFKADNLKSLFYLDIQTYLNSVVFFYLCDNEISIFYKRIFKVLVLYFETEN